MKLSAWKPQDKGYICLPLKRNVPIPHPDWKLTICPKCGEECWESDLAREVLSHGNAIGACTTCALRAGLK
jgi:RNase P subunit RPR2